MERAFVQAVFIAAAIEISADRNADDDGNGDQDRESAVPIGGTGYQKNIFNISLVSSFFWGFIFNIVCQDPARARIGEVTVEFWYNFSWTILNQD